jgi:hypothetical protein
MPPAYITTVVLSDGGIDRKKAVLNGPLVGIYA